MIKKEKNTAVMGIISVILLITIVVALASAVYLIVTSFVPSGSAPVAVVISSELEESLITLSPQAGGPLYYNSTEVFVVVNGLQYPLDFTSYLSTKELSNGIWNAGEYITVDIQDLTGSYSSSQSVVVKVVDSSSNTLVYDTTLQKGMSLQSPNTTPQLGLLSPKNISFQGAVLQLSCTLGSYSSVQVRFQYKKQSESTWQQTEWSFQTTEGLYSERISQLKSNTNYELFAELKYGINTLSSIQKTSPPQMDQ